MQKRKIRSIGQRRPRAAVMIYAFAMTTTASHTLRTLGNSDLQLTPIGFGAWAIGGGDWQYAWGPQDDNDSIAAIHRALDLGINWIDTAAVYGLGHSEESRRPRREILGAQALHLHQVLHALARRRLASTTRSRPRRLPKRWKPRCAACRWKPSISTRSTGPIPTRRSKRDGRRWPACASRASCAGSAFPISMSSR